MYGIGIFQMQHFLAMLERGVCSFFYYLNGKKCLQERLIIVLYFNENEHNQYNDLKLIGTHKETKSYESPVKHIYTSDLQLYFS